MMDYADMLRSFCKIYNLRCIYSKILSRHVVEIVGPNGGSCYAKTLDYSMFVQLMTTSRISEEDACKTLVGRIADADVINYYTLSRSPKTVDVSRFKTLEALAIWIELNKEEKKKGI